LNNIQHCFNPKSKALNNLIRSNYCKIKIILIEKNNSKGNAEEEFYQDLKQMKEIAIKTIIKEFFSCIVPNFCKVIT
jgi:hypothetical protein